MPLIISRDPAGASGRDIYEMDTTKTIQQNIETHLESGFDAALWINGLLIESPIGCADLDRLAHESDDVRVGLRPEGLDPISWVILGISIAVSAASFFLLPKPAIPNDMGAGKDSPNNRLTGQTNLARLYQAIPDIYGQIRAYPDLIQQSIIEYVDNLKRITEWVCVGRGKYTLEQIRYAETLLSDITGASYEAFYPVGGAYPEYGTTTVNDIYESFETPDVNGQELEYAIPYPMQSENTAVIATVMASSVFTLTVPIDIKWAQLIELFPFLGTALVFAKLDSDLSTLINANCDCVSYTSGGGDYVFTFNAPSPFANTSTVGVNVEITPNKATLNPTNTFNLPVELNTIRWNTVFLRGLKGTVQIRATWFKIDSGGVEIGGTRQSQTDTFTRDTFNAQYFTTTVTPSAGLGRYRIFFERLTAQIGDQGTDVAKLEEVFAMKYYAYKEFKGVTIMRLTTVATESATSGQERKFNVVVTRHVRDFGTTVCTPSRSFARAILHQFVAIAKFDIAKLDVAALQLVQSQAPGELGYFDFSFDDKDVSLEDRLRTAANVARVQVFRDGTQHSFVRDQAGAGFPAVQFDYRNLAADGDSTITYRGHLPTSFDSIELEYVNPADNKKAIVKLRVNASGVVESGTGARASKIQLAGCRNVAQATNRAYLEANKLIYQRTSVSDTALKDAALVGIGEVCRWVDPNDFFGDDGLQAGEVMDIYGTNITTSEPIHWNGNASGRVIFTTATGTSLSPVVCTPRLDSVSGFVVASLPSGVYLSDGSDIQLGSRYSVGVGLTAEEIQKAGLYTLTSKKPSENGTIAIELINYDERIYSLD